MICRNRLGHTRGFQVVDAHGRYVGTVEWPVYGRSAHVPEAIAVRSGPYGHHRRLVPADAIETVDDATRVIGLRVDRGATLSLL